MERFLITLTTGIVIAALTCWIFYFLGNREKKLAFIQMEEEALKKGDESLSLLLQQCQNEEEREIVYNFAREQLEKEEQKEKELQVIMERETVNQIDQNMEQNFDRDLEKEKNIEDTLQKREDQQIISSEIIAPEKSLEDDDEYTRIINKNSLI